MLASAPVLGRLFKLLKGRTVMVPDSAKLAEGEARTVDIGDPHAGGTQIVLCRVEGKIYALDSLCPHEGGRLAPGPLMEGRYAICPLHSYRFDPKNGKAVGVSCRSAKTFRVKERGGNCEVWV